MCCDILSSVAGDFTTTHAWHYEVKTSQQGLDFLNDLVLVDRSEHRGYRLFPKWSTRSVKDFKVLEVKQAKTISIHFHHLLNDAKVLGERQLRLLGRPQLIHEFVGHFEGAPWDEAPKTGHLGENFRVPSCRIDPFLTNMVRHHFRYLSD